jgi:hypothetical protein
MNSFRRGPALFVLIQEAGATYRRYLLAVYFFFGAGGLATCR